MAVFGLLAVVGLEILITYSRLPARELYHVSGTGLAAGASRALVFVNYPVALAALPVLLLVLERLAGGGARVLAVVAGVLCAAVFWPGVVDQADLDARPVNALAGAGVALTLLLAVRVARRPHWPPRHEWGDPARLGLAACVLLVAVPWIAADLGFGFDGVPVLGTLWQTGELRSQPGVAGLHPAVHHGHHHGMDGTLLVVTALLLSRTLGTVAGRGLARVLSAYLALMLSYGLGNIANDAWLEQVVKRGWTAWEIPDVTRPKLSVAWAVIVAGAAVIWLAGAWRSRRAGRDELEPALGNPA